MCPFEPQFPRYRLKQAIGENAIGLGPCFRLAAKPRCKELTYQPPPLRCAHTIVTNYAAIVQKQYKAWQ